MNKIKSLFVTGCLLLTVAMTVAAHERSLYERLGGETAITSVVDDFVARATNDARINRKFDAIDVMRLKSQLVEGFLTVTGAPRRNVGEDANMPRLNIEVTNTEFDALTEDFVASLDKFKVSANEKNELLGVLKSATTRTFEVNSNEADNGKVKSNKAQTTNGQGAMVLPPGTRCVPLRIPS